MYAEVIGTEGSGKTTFCKDACRGGIGNLVSWDLIKDKAIRSFIVNSEIRLNSFDRVLNILGCLIPKLMRYLVQARVKYNPETYDADWMRFLAKLIEVQISELDTYEEILVHRIDLLVEVCMRSRIASVYNPETSRILLDEGISHYAAFDQRLWNLAIMPDLVVFVNTKPESAFERIIERRTKKVNRLHRYLTDDQIITSIGRQYKCLNGYVEFLKNGGVPVVEYCGLDNEIEDTLTRIERILGSC